MGRSYSYDTKMVLDDGATAHTASGKGTVAAAATILNLGGALLRTDLGIVGAEARVDAAAVVDVTAITTATDGNYELSIMGSNNADGSLPVELACHHVGLGSGIPNGSAAGTDVAGTGSTTTPGKREILFTNEQNGVIYQYIYLYVSVLGSTSHSITVLAYVSLLPIE